MQTIFTKLVALILFLSLFNYAQAGCVASFTVSTNALRVSFTNTSTGTDTTTKYKWTMGDGTVTHAVNPSHTYASAGSYIVCLTISSKTCFDTKCDTIMVNNFSTTCFANFTDSISDLAAYFKNTSTGVDTATKYKWDFGDGFITHVVNPKHIYASGGVYSVCLIIQNLAKQCSDTFCGSVTVANCAANFTWVDTGMVVTVTGASTGVDSNTFYHWTFGDGSIANNIQNLRHTYATAGKYQLCLTISNSKTGCNSTFCDSVTVVKPANTCTAGFIYADTGLAVTFTNTSTGVDTNTKYTYFFGDGNLTHVVNPTYIYPSAGSYKVCLVIENYKENCSDTFCTSITLASCQANFTWVDTGMVVTVYDASTGVYPNTSYHWMFGDGSIANNIRNLRHTYAAPGKYQVCLTINNTKTGCNSVFCDSVTVVKPANTCTAGFIYADTGLAVTFTNISTGVDTNTKYTYFFGDGNLTHVVNPTYIYSSAGSYKVCLVIENYKENCSDTFCTSITLASCQANFTWVDTGMVVTVYDASTGVYPNTSYHWMFGDGSIANNIRNLRHTYAAPGKYQVCLTISNTKTDCNSMFCDSVTAVKPANTCSAGFTYADTGLAVTFTNTSIGVDTNTKYTYFFGDGNLTHVINPTYIYSSAGTYKVCLVIENYKENCSDTFCASITLTSCQANFTWVDTGMVVTVYDASTGVYPNTYYHWTFGDGSIANNITSLHHTYVAPGKYQVCLTINNTKTGCNSMFCDSVTVVKPANTCSAGFTYADTGLAVTFTNTSTGVDTNTKYTYFFGDGNLTHVVNPTYIYPSGGTYTVCLVIENYKENCSDTFCTSITLTTCQANFTYTDTGLLVTLTNASTGTDSNTYYKWTTGDGGVSHNENIQHSYSAPGKYQICLIISNTKTGCNSTICDSVAVDTLASTCNASFVNSVGEGYTKYFTNTSTGTSANTFYTWHFGNGALTHIINPTYTYDTAGTYTVCLTIRDTAGAYCESTYCDTVSVTAPVSVCQADFTFIAKGTGVIFTNKSKHTTVNTEYRWDMGDGHVLREENPTHRYAGAGSYYVCLTITDSTETYCKSTYCDTVKVSLTGINQVSFPGTSLYYDPASSQLFVNWQGEDNVNISLVDVLGQTDQNLYSGQVSTGSYRFKINNSSLAAGIYFVRVSANDGAKAWKIFVLPH